MTIDSSGENRNALFVENDEPSIGTLIAPCACPAANESASRTSRIVPRLRSRTAREASARHERPAVQRDDALHVRRAQLRAAGGLLDELVLGRDRHRMVEPPLEADRRRRLRAHADAAKGAGDVTRVHLDAVGQLRQPAQRMEETLRAGARLDRKVGSRRVADEQRVAGEHEPRLVAPVTIADGERAVLRPVARRVDRPDRDRADVHDGAVVSGSCGNSASAAPWMWIRQPWSSARRPWPDRWSACVCVSSTP